MTLASALFGVATALACGPFFPDNALDQPKGILQPPLFHFQSELNSLPLPEGISKHAPGTPAFTLDLEMAEIAEMMPDRSEGDPWMARYRALRRSMISDGDASEQSMQKADSDAVVAWPKMRRDVAEIIAPLPVDVRLYLEGAAAWLDAQNRADESATQKAREIWQRLLALPAAERPWRSTWAAWMLFRTGSHDEQGHWLSETRKRWQEGFKDCLHLGIEAAYILGRPASDYAERSQVSKIEWKRVSMLRAMLGLNRADDHLRHDRWEHTAWNADFALEVVSDPFLRRVQMLHLIEVAHSGTGWESGHQRRSETPEDLLHWLDSFEKAKIQDQSEAGLLAWIYYNAAKFDLARRWLVLAPKEDVNAQVLRGKLAAMRGDRREAESQLTRISQRIPELETGARADWERARDHEWFPLHTRNYRDVRHHRMLADCGVAQVARNDFAGALQTFLRTDYWLDAAYIAERLLSVEELLTLSRAGKLPRLEKMIVPDAEPPKAVTISTLEEKYGNWGRPEGINAFTYLVARRLAREGYYKDALRLFPDDLASALERYAIERRRGNDRRLSKAERAEALWTAAQIERQLGMELFAFETGPDNAFCGGAFDWNDVAEMRGKASWYPDWQASTITADQIALCRPVFPATADESWRMRHYAPRVNKRFHYRHTAADLAWRAADLMPRDNEQTARVLGIAGSWLKRKEPLDADRFYKAMVRWNPNVELAQEADQKRWFPEIPWRFDLELKQQADSN